MSPQERLKALTAQLTTSEMATVLSGKDLWHLHGLPNHGIPSIRVSDGPSGVRGTKTFNSTKTACFPCATATAATWDADLLERLGHEMANQAKAKGVHMVLGPTINIHRSPLGGRNFESFSEDPLLSGIMGCAIVNGLQRNQIGAVVKHFVCNDQETNRSKVNVIIDERALREIYLKPFEMVCKTADPWAIMAAYNRVNGLHMSENVHLLDEVLRKTWRWNGLIMSDWGGTYSTAAAVSAGLDVEMPGPTRWRGERLMSALEAGKITVAQLHERAHKFLTLASKVKASGIPENVQEAESDSAESRALNEEVASKAIVLLKNNLKILPLRESRRIAILGPNARRRVAMGGGSATVSPYYYVSAFDGISKAVKDQWSDSEIVFAEGCHPHDLLPVLESTRVSGEEGLDIQVYAGDLDFKCKAERNPITSMSTRSCRMILFDKDCVPSEALPVMSLYMTGYFTPSVDGEYEFGVITSGRARLLVNSELLIDNWTKQEKGKHFFGLGTVEVRNTVYLRAGEECQINVEYSNRSSFEDRRSDILFGGALQIGLSRVISDAELIEEASDAASTSDICILCLGTDGDRESEGFDRTTMKLPGAQDELARAVLAARPETVVVNFSGSAIEMPWADQAATIVQAWFLGSQLGTALANVLLGNTNPSGKLPITFPRKLEHTPSYGNFPGDLDVHYAEGILVGYRHFLTRDISPLFPFGHGLSYTTFEYSELGASELSSSAGKSVTIDLAIKNTGHVSGDAVVQIYIGKPGSPIPRASRELKAFKTIRGIAVNETRPLQFGLNIDSFSHWDVSRQEWRVEPGRYCIEAAESSELVLATCFVDISSSTFAS